MENAFTKIYNYKISCSMSSANTLTHWHSHIYNVHTQSWRALYVDYGGFRMALVLTELVCERTHLFLSGWFLLEGTCSYQVGKGILARTKLVGDQQWPLLAPLTLATLPSHPCSTGYNITKHKYNRNVIYGTLALLLHRIQNYKTRISYICSMIRSCVA